MIKRILALVLALTMVASLTTVMVGAVNMPELATLDVPVDIKAKVDDGEFATDSLSVSTTSAGTPTFELKAEVDTEKLMDEVEGYFYNDPTFPENHTVSGELTLTLEIPDKMTVDEENIAVTPNGIFDGTAVVTGGNVVVTLTIPAKTVAEFIELAENADTKLEIVCTGVKVTAFGEYTIEAAEVEGGLLVSDAFPVSCVLDAADEGGIGITINVSKKTLGGGGGSVDYPYGDKDKEDKPVDPTPVDPTPVDPTPAGGFTDVKGHWGEDAIEFVVEKNLFKGTSATTFSPNASTTRGMIAVVLHNYEENPVHDYAGDFADVEHNKWYTEGIAWLSATGVTTGYSDGTFGHDDNVTREQLATFLYRFAQHKSYDVAADDVELSFADTDKISAYAKEAIAWAVANGILNGKGGNMLDPKGEATRAEVAAMMQRFVLAYNK